jgi:DNA-binding beta-propeller fold protein YncE
MFRLHSRSGSRRRLGLGVATAAVLVAVAAPAAHAAPFAYVANQSDGTVSQYDIGAGGLLAPLSPPTVAARQGPWPVATPPEPSGLAVSPDGKSVYVAIIGFDYDAWPVQSGVTQFDVGAGGTLSPKSPAAIFTSCETVRVVVSPDGKSVYGSGSPDCAFLTQFDVGAGGTLSLKSPAYVQAFEGLGIAVSPDSRSVYVANGSDNVSQYDADAGGSLSPKSPPTVAADRSARAVAVSPDGKSVYVPVYDESGGIGSVFQYDVGSGGKLSPKSPPRVAAGPYPDAVAVSPDGKSVYVTNGVSVSQYDVGQDGALSPKSPAFVEGPAGDGIAVSPDGKSVYVLSGGFSVKGTVSQYDVGQGGALSLKSPATVTAGLGARAVAVSPPGRPTSKKQCRHGGWRQFGFKNQGRCIRFVKYGPKR